MKSKYELGPEWDIDYTKQDNPDRNLELNRRLERDLQIKKQLQSGEPAYYRSSGWSLYPYVSSGNGCTYVPVKSQEDVQVRDIVFCEVQSFWKGNKSRFYAHLVRHAELDAEEGSSGQMRYIIGNATGHQNGWCHIQHIFGRLIDIEP